MKITTLQQNPFSGLWLILPPFIDILFLSIIERISPPKVEIVLANPEIASEADIDVSGKTNAKSQADSHVALFSAIDDPVSQYKMGKAFLEGNGFEKNNEEAFKWFLRSSNQGHVNAQLEVGRMYFMGEGTPRNYDESYFWYSLATKQGKLQKWADSVERYLSPRQIAEVKKRVVEWKPAQSRGAMKLIELDAKNWHSFKDYLTALKAALGSPEWHGNNIDAFLDSMIWGDINKVEPPYTVKIINASGLSKPIRNEIELLSQCLMDARAESKKKRGFDVDVKLEIDPGKAGAM